MTENRLPLLHTTVFDRLKDDFNYWQYVIGGIVWFSQQILNNRNSDIKYIYKSNWEESDKQYYITRRSIHNAIHGDISHEIESNTLLIDSNYKGVAYLNKWAGLNNSIYAFINGPISNQITDLSILNKKTSIDKATAKKCIRNTEQLICQYTKLCKAIAYELSKLLWYKQHADIILIDKFSSILLASQQPTPTDQEPEPVEPDKGLSALQRLLFVRLLQQSGLFPKKPVNTDDAPELRGIALLTGLDYNNDIKGGKGANAKVNQLLNERERRSFTPQQIPHKLADLNAVENVARLLNVEPVISAIQLIRTDLEKSRGS